jgi:hypothetical protein
MYNAVEFCTIAEISPPMRFILYDLCHYAEKNLYLPTAPKIEKNALLSVAGRVGFVDFYITGVKVLVKLEKDDKSRENQPKMNENEMPKRI